MKSPHKFQVILADDHPLILTGLKIIISRNPEYHIAGEATNPSELFSLLNSTKCDILLTDFFMPHDRNRDGFEMVSKIRDRWPELSMLIVTMLEDPIAISALLCLGVKGIISKSSLEKTLSAALFKASIGQRFIDPSISYILKKAGMIRGNIVLLTVDEADAIRTLKRNTATHQELVNSEIIDTTKSVMRKLRLNTKSELIEFLGTLNI